MVKLWQGSDLAQQKRFTWIQESLRICFNGCFVYYYINGGNKRRARTLSSLSFFFYLFQISLITLIFRPRFAPLLFCFSVQLSPLYFVSVRPLFLGKKKRMESFKTLNPQEVKFRMISLSLLWEYDVGTFNWLKKMDLKEM